MAFDDVVFLLDVDNTLLDGDRIVAGCPAADRTVERIGDLLGLDDRALLGADMPAVAERW